MSRRLLYLITEDWFFCSHFLERAEAARAAGYEVLVMTRVGGQGPEPGARIRAAGLRLLPLRVQRRGTNPLAECGVLRQILAAYRHERPDIVHHVALKPILYGTLAARLCGITAVINAPVGLGYVFTSEAPRARLLRPLVQAGLKVLLNPTGSRVVFENPDDLAGLAAAGIVRREAAVLIRGAGVDTQRFRPLPEPAGTPVVTLVARMLRDKGVGEFVEAARLLRAQGVEARLQLVGEPDPGNPAAIPEAQLHEWQRSGLVCWLGRREDVAEILAGSHVVCLPSYREGLPKSLLEGLAAGRALVATDVPGCREAVRHGENGLLVPPRDAPALAAALAQLLRDPDLRARFGARGRERAVAEFATPRIVAQTLDLYARMPAG